MKKEDKIVLDEKHCHILEDLFRKTEWYIYKVEIEKQGQENHFSVSFTS